MVSECVVCTGTIGDQEAIRIRGRGTWRIARSIKEYFETLGKRIPPPARVLIDLSECEYMDSTCIGVLAFATKVISENQGRLVLLNLQKEVESVLKTMGLLHVVDHENDPEFANRLNWKTLVGEKDVAVREEPEFIYETHKELEEIDESNKERFAVLKKVLQEKIFKKNKEKS